MIAIGADGWRGGWAIATLTDERRVTWSAGPDFTAVLDAYPDATIGVDMPIGTTPGPRPADLAARTWLSAHGAARQSIFLAPDRATVDAFRRGLTHAQAMAARENGSPGTSIQAWNLIARMVEVEAALEDRRRSAHEVHPECSFRLLDPRIGATSKKTARGTGLRLRALQGVLDLPPLDKAPPLVPLDDLLDATVVAWTASRIAKRAADLVILGPDDGPRITI